jgi:hypothetical protein
MTIYSRELADRATYCVPHSFMKSLYAEEPSEIAPVNQNRVQACDFAIQKRCSEIIQQYNSDE